MRYKQKQVQTHGETKNTIKQRYKLAYIHSALISERSKISYFSVKCVALSEKKFNLVNQM